MIKYEYEKQNDGSDAWIAIETTSEGEEITRYMVYDNPFKQTKVDLKSILGSATPEEIEFIKQLLK